MLHCPAVRAGVWCIKDLVLFVYSVQRGHKFLLVARLKRPTTDRQ